MPSPEQRLTVAKQAAPAAAPAPAAAKAPTPAQGEPTPAVRPAPVKGEPTPAVRPTPEKGEPTLAKREPTPAKQEPTPAKPPESQLAQNGPTLADPNTRPQEAELAPRVEKQFALDLSPPLPTELEMQSPTEDLMMPAPTPVVETPDPVLPALPRAPTTVRPEEVPDRTPLVIAEPTPPSQPPGEVWPASPQLKALVARVAVHPECEAWASRLDAKLSHLEGLPLDSKDAGLILDQMVIIHNDASTLAEQLGYSWKRTDMLQVGFALKRRLSIWRPLHECALADDGVRAAPLDPQQMAQPLNRVEDELRTGGELLSWSDFLMLDHIRDAMSLGYPELERRKLARKILGRLESPGLDQAQQKLLATAPFDPFRAELIQWAAEDVTLATALRQIEQFESTLSTTDSTRLADSCLSLHYSPKPHVAALADLIDQHYRNANCRIAVNASFLDALLPQMEPAEQDVDDHILGNRVLGRSRRETELKLRFAPDPIQWRVQLDVVGVVDSNTSSHSGPVTVFNHGRSYYYASKQLVVNPLGFWVSPATASAQTTTGINGLRTDYDEVPLIGSIVRSVARNQSEAKQVEARHVVERKVEKNAMEQLDAGLNEKVDLWQDKLLSMAVDPLNDMGLSPAVVDMNTTAEQLVGRFRIAGDMQLAAHTPRPVAFEDSALSLQLHESTLNNSVRQLQLAGRRYRLDDVVRRIESRLPQTEGSLLEQLPEGVEVVFADEDPIEIRVYDGKIEMTVAIAELANGDRVYRNFRVIVAYSPQINGLQAELAREGTIKLDGPELGFGGQIALRGVFAKVFSKHRTLPIIPPQVADDSRLQQFELSQLALYDGWVALSISPKAAVAADTQEEPKVRIGHGAILQKILH
ncbi:hypothetical protein [Blastopirellula marina]|uniref:Uncharacterized protein n=1 Tax=Blastopirellula marina TaxID=124 RepID=A0A2S8GFS4_9BACT|nr:hypothetical protein [Blastopirellula marina]PQO43101.1 hypothetical protein C5Y93_25660 [Blastopirellula marina]